MMFDFAMIGAGAALLLAWMKRREAMEYWLGALAFMHGSFWLLAGMCDLARRAVLEATR